ncbi:2'-5' RNA ligase family protein [Dinghuibacter silviterrae]|uniref:2'-5' RNA ligase superfamily protein n=1 Tax=Dinghuibacter silviterrae TaxID=1539049 RepID=A0A4R8DXK9_9BACT|nr:2'-5' RNA ligase family protein [Dinghuibacter silviterrae]TDX02167.1 2'-5' RNA ligase superfamily protein [Dinghuibacter silviterrae]
MSNNIRRQLTLFVEENDAIRIESVREKFNPVQCTLIQSHVTLCREDELVNLEKIVENLRKLDAQPVTIKFAGVARFDNGKGVFLPGATANNEFHQLRKKILQGATDLIRQIVPHITLMHPRNSCCTDDIFEVIRTMDLPTCLTFNEVSLIEQIGAGRWQTKMTYPLQ